MRELEIDPVSLARIKSVIEQIPALAGPGAEALAKIKGWIEEKEAQNAGADVRETVGDILREWKLTNSEEQEEEEDPVAKCPVTKNMIAAGRAYLNAHPDRDADDYGVKQVMARVEPKHDAVQSLHALSALGQEFSNRKAKRA